MRKRGLTGSFWPSRRQEALLRLALVPDVDVERSWRDLQPLEIETLEAGTFALLPLVYLRLQDAGVRDPRLPRLSGIYRSNWVKNQLQLERLPSLLAAMTDAGIEPLVVGGPSIATRYYAQLGLRPILQLEALVPPGEGARATSRLSSRGWRLDSRAPGRTSRLVDERTRTAALLYEGLPAYFRGPIDPATAVGTIKFAAEERPIAGAPAMTLDPADELLLACGLWARRTPAPGIQWLLDVHHILAAGEVDEARLAARTRDHRLVRPLRETLMYLTRTGAGGTEAERILQALEQERPTRRDGLTYRMAASGLGPLGMPPEGLIEHARLSLDEPLSSALRAFPSFMRDAWGLERVDQVPLVAARKMLRRMHRVATPRAGARSQ
jgi:hypothetical protein